MLGRGSRNWPSRALLAARQRGVPTAVVDFRCQRAHEPVTFLDVLARQVAPLDLGACHQSKSELEGRFAVLIRMLPVEGSVSVEVSRNRFHGSVGDISGVKTGDIHVTLPPEELHRLRDERTALASDAFHACLPAYDGPAPVVVLDSAEHVLGDLDGDNDSAFAAWLWATIIDPPAGRRP